MAKQIKELETPNLKQDFSAKLLGEAIRARRTQSQLRLEDAALLCGVAKQTFMNIEHGKDTCQIGSILQVCKGLGIKINIACWNDAKGEYDDE